MLAFIMLLLTGPRVLSAFWYLLVPRRWESAFDSAVWPILGWLLVPWTTLVFVIVSPNGSIEGADWLWLALAFTADWFSTISGLFRLRMVRAAPSS